MAPMDLSHHTSNPMEAASSDPLNTRYHATLQQAELGVDESSDDPLSISVVHNYHNHISEVVSTRRLGPYDIIHKASPSEAAKVRRVVKMAVSEDELTLGDDDESISQVARMVKLEMPQMQIKREVKEEIKEEEMPLEFPEEDEEEEEEDMGYEVKREKQEGLEYTVKKEYENDLEEWECELEGDLYTAEHFPDEDDEMYSVGDDASRPGSRLESMSPLTPISSHHSTPYSSPQSSRPASPDEAETLKSRPQDEQDEIRQEIAQLYASVPELDENYALIDRLGTGTFSSVYKAIDLNYHHFDNEPWKGHHPLDSTAYYQSAGPSYKGRGGRAPGWRQTTNRMNEEKQEMDMDAMEPTKDAYAAVKRIYTTSGPERIRNELSIMEECRGTRHTSQIITAFRNGDQVVIVLPYQRNMDFRDFYQSLHPEGIKCYFRCLFRALRDIHARGIIHRDVKPANFLYDPFTGIGTLCDFGLASRIEYSDHVHAVGRCYHTPATADAPHGKHRQQLDQNETYIIKKAQKEARWKSGLAPEKVGYPEKDRRPLSKANRAGTRGFRAPEVLLKCSAQTGAIDVWSAGIILLFFLTGKFPIFQSNDDVEGLMEIAMIIGKKKMEKIATLHGRTFATNVPDLDQDGISWQQFVEKLNPGISQPRKYDMRFYPHNSKHRDGRGSTATTAMNSMPPPPPPTYTPSSPVSLSGQNPLSETVDAPTTARDARYANPMSTERLDRELPIAYHLLEGLLQIESTKRYTPRDALYHSFLDEASVDADDMFAPHPPGTGVCREFHTIDEDGVHWAKVWTECQCKQWELKPWDEVKLPKRNDFGEVIEEEEYEEPEGGGHVVMEMLELQAGQGIAIGRNPCEYHRDAAMYHPKL